jgi:beta-mannanase
MKFGKTAFFSILFFRLLCACASVPTRAAGSEPNFIRTPLPIDFNIKGCYTGAVIDWRTVDDGHPWTVTAADLDRYISLAGKKPAFLLTYKAFSQSGKPYAFPREAADFARAHDIVPYITWEPRDWDPQDPRSKTQSLLGEILDGKWDAYLDSWIEGIRAYGSPLLLRFGHEMNGNWYPWSGVYNGGGGHARWTGSAQTDGPRTYIEAYRYVFARFYRAGIRNVIWIWSPNAESAPAESWNRFENYYPGDACVDLVALDVYNWGSCRSWSKWKSFDEIYGKFYEEASRLAPGKPIMIGEFGCAQKGQNRAQWFRDCFRSLKTRFIRTKIFTYFHIDNRESEDADFRIDADQESAPAMREAMRDPYFIDMAVLQ